jgi:hypothetical protein
MEKKYDHWSNYISTERPHYWYDVFCEDYYTGNEIVSDKEFQKKYGHFKVRKMTQDEFIKYYDDIKSSISKHHGWYNYGVSKRGGPESSYRNSEIDMSHFIYFIAKHNSWLGKKKWSKRLAEFLELKGVTFDSYKRSIDSRISNIKKFK